MTDISMAEDLPFCQPRNGLPNTFEKLRDKNATLRVAYFGGSITQAEGWRVQTRDWLRESFPATIVEIPAAIGGTGSDLGVFRMDKDVLAHEPDLVFVEFAVNDYRTDPSLTRCAMEGIVRKIRKNLPSCEICFVYTFSQYSLEALCHGYLPFSMQCHEEIATHYGIPSIHMWNPVVNAFKQNQLVFTAPPDEREALQAQGIVIFAGDPAHPTPQGHLYYTEAVKAAFTILEGFGTPGSYTCPAPLANINGEIASIVDIDDVSRSGTWVRQEGDERPRIAWSEEFLPVVWTTTQPRAAFSFRFRGTAFGITDVIGPDSGRIRITVDGQELKTSTRFDKHCNYYRIFYKMLANNLPDTEHEVRIELDATVPDKASILAENNLKDPPELPDAIAFHPGKLLLIGELL